MSARAFWLCLSSCVAAYLIFWLLLLGATASYTTPQIWLSTLMKPELRYATWLSLATSTGAAGLALVLAIPISYLMARRQFPGKAAVDAALDIPIVLPPMVVGLCLLIFFQTSFGKKIESILPFTFTISGVVLAQFVVAASFAIRTLRSTFDHLSARPEEVALTLGATRFQAFHRIALPSARRGIIASFCIAWARSLGEFGPILVFAGSTRFKTEVLPTSVWLELSAGNLEGAVTISLLMIVIAILVLVAVRTVGERV
jgi:molybdate transport system permease protein